MYVHACICTVCCSMRLCLYQCQCESARGSYVCKLQQVQGTLEQLEVHGSSMATDPNLCFISFMKCCVCLHQPSIVSFSPSSSSVHDIHAFKTKEVSGSHLKPRVVDCRLLLEMGCTLGDTP